MEPADDPDPDGSDDDPDPPSDPRDPDLPTDGDDPVEWRSAAEDVRADGPPADDYEVVALFEGTAGEGRSCTLVPRHADESEITTRWITGDAGATVSLDEVR